MIFSRSLEFPLLFLFFPKFHIAVGIYPSQYSYKFHVLNCQPSLLHFWNKTSSIEEMP